MSDRGYIAGYHYGRARTPSGAWTTFRHGTLWSGVSDTATFIYHKHFGLVRLAALSSTGLSGVCEANALTDAYMDGPSSAVVQVAGSCTTTGARRHAGRPHRGKAKATSSGA